jgi:hypothetical protein
MCTLLPSTDDDDPDDDPDVRPCYFKLVQTRRTKFSNCTQGPQEDDPLVPGAQEPEHEVGIQVTIEAEIFDEAHANNNRRHDTSKLQ